MSRALAFAFLLLAAGMELFSLHMEDVARHERVPVALEPHCTITRIHHPDPRRLVRRVSSCAPLDTIVEPR